MEKVRPWCGQPSDRGRLRNRTELGPGDIVLDGTQLRHGNGHSSPPPLFGPCLLRLVVKPVIDKNILCCDTVAHLSNWWALVVPSCQCCGRRIVRDHCSKRQHYRLYRVVVSPSVCPSPVCNSSSGKKTWHGQRLILALCETRQPVLGQRSKVCHVVNTVVSVWITSTLINW